jgi:hypothetical protein
MNSARVMLPADPAYRRRVFLVATVGVLIAAAVLLWVTQWGLPMLVAYLRRAGEDGMRRVKVAAVLSQLIPLVACFYMFRLGLRIQKSAQLPAPGTRVIYDTPVVQGRRARQYGTAIIVLSVVIALLVVALAVLFARL